MAGERLTHALKGYRTRYRKASNKQERGAVLTEFCKATNYHRKYAIALLNRPEEDTPSVPRRRGASYSAAAMRAVERIWKAAGHPWSCRLKALMPLWLPWARKHVAGLTPEMEDEALRISARQIDRRLKDKKRLLKRRLYGRTKPGTLLKHHIPIKTDYWDVTEPGSAEIDLVSHSGPCASGEFGHSLNLTDIQTGWVETRAILGKSEVRVTGALDEIRRTLPFGLHAIDSDNGSEFINHHLHRYTQRHKIQFTRSRPYKKDDNAHIEQKNWTHVRKVFGWERYDTQDVIDAMNDLCRNELRLMMNLFQPSVKLREKVRVGPRLRRHYDTPKTPLDRLLEHYAGQALPLAVQKLVLLRERLDPFELAQRIETKLHAIERMRATGTPAKELSVRAQ